MATYVTSSELDGLFKEVYSDKLENLIPQQAICTKMIGFSERAKLGNVYHQPVILTNEHGVTYADNDDDAFALQQSVALNSKDAQVEGYQMLLRSKIGYKAAAKAQAGGKKAFAATTGLVVKNMLESITKRLEIQLLYGQSGIATVEDSTSVSGDATTILHISDASWAPGIWTGMENAYINVYNGTSLFGTAGVPPATGTADMQITAIDFDNKKITISGDSTVIGTINTAAQASGAALTLYFQNAYSKEFAGINKILTNTGTLFNINAASYHLWKSNAYAVDGGFTVAKLISGMAKPVSKGGLDEKVELLINPEVWAEAMTDQAALRDYDYSYNKEKAEYGHKSITFYTQSGAIEVISHPCVKIGDGFVVPMKRLMRVGATDITFNNPGTKDKFFRELNDNAGFELRCYTDQALFCECPAKTLKLTGITVS